MATRAVAGAFNTAGPAAGALAPLLLSPDGAGRPAAGGLRLPSQPLDQLTARRIGDLAHTLWTEFLEYHVAGYTGHDLLSPQLFEAAWGVPGAPAAPAATAQAVAPPLLSGLPRNKCATDFFSYCCEVVLGVPGHVVNYPLDVGVPKRNGRATSWLWNIPTAAHPVSPWVTIDADYLYARLGIQLPRVWTQLLLHETGHLVLHWPDFEQLCRKQGVAVATARQEAEAWHFCACVRGLAIGQYASDAVHGPAHEDAWRLV